LNKLINYTNQSCVLSNDLNTFELYIPAIDLKKLEECFSCKETVKLENITELVGLGSIINSFNSNSNNSNSTVGNTNSLNSCCTESNTSDCEKIEIQKRELEVKEQLDRIEKEVQYMNYREQSFLPFVIIICLVLVVVILIIAKNL